MTGTVMRTLPGTVMEFDSPVQVVLNVLALGCLLLGVVDVLRRPALQWRRAEFSRWYALAVVGAPWFPTGSIHGVYVPLGPAVYAVWVLPKLLRGRRDQDGGQASAA